MTERQQNDIDPEKYGDDDYIPMQHPTDRDRCIICGYHVCECHNSNTTMNKIETTTLAELGDFKPDQPIPRIEGYLITIHAPDEKSQYPKQKGTMRDEQGNEHWICFATKNVFQDPAKVKGKKLRLTCKFGKNGATGVKLKQEEYQGKTYRKIWVTSTANIEIINGENVAAPPARSENGNPQSTERPGPPPEQHRGDDVDHRINRYFRIMERVWAGYTHYLEKETIPELTTDDLKDITTHISMTYRGQYGAYAPPVFRKESSQSTEEPEVVNEGVENPPMDKGQAKEAEAWTQFYWDSLKMTLGEIADDETLGIPKLQELYAWSLTNDSNNPKIKKARAMLGVMAAAYEITPKIALQRSINTACETNYTQEGLDAYAQETFGVAFDQLDDDDSIVILAEGKKAYDKIMSLSAQSTETEEEDDELPA